MKFDVPWRDKESAGILIHTSTRGFPKFLNNTSSTGHFFHYFLSFVWIWISTRPLCVSIYIAGGYDYYRSIFHQFGVKAIKIVSFLGLEIGLGSGITQLSGGIS